MSASASDGHREPHPGPLPDRAYHTMSLTLRAGLGFALGFFFVFSVLYVALNSHVGVDQVLDSNPILGYLSLSGFWSGLSTGHVQAYLTLGVFALLATPVARVAVGAFFFAEHRERIVAVITATVFAMLLIGLLVLGPYLR